VVRCPETGQAAAVELDPFRAALKVLFGAPALRLRDCSHWPERHDCSRACLQQIEAAPDDCLVRTILTKWYAGKSCVCCGQPLEEITWTRHKPCLMSPDLRIIEWQSLEPETIPYVLETHQPVCWNCNLADTHIF
jgi:hypothetical protein